MPARSGLVIGNEEPIHDAVRVFSPPNAHTTLRSVHAASVSRPARRQSD
jgi:hypothetical protein